MNSHANKNVRDSLDAFDALVEKVGLKAIAQGYLKARRGDGIAFSEFYKQNFYSCETVEENEELSIFNIGDDSADNYNILSVDDVYIHGNEYKHFDAANDDQYAMAA